MTKATGRSIHGALVCALTCLVAAGAQAQPIAPSASHDEIAELKAQLADQQKQIQQLRADLEQYKQLLEGGGVARGKPEVAAAVPPAAGTAPGAGRRAASSEPEEAPLHLKIGTAAITPVGFMDLTGVYRSTNQGSGTGTNFGSIPYNNTAAGRIGESRLSAQLSRIGLRVDAAAGGAKVLGYLESDFLGAVPANAAVTSHSDTMRLRLYWVDVRRSKVELLAGQSWSLLTPNRRGLSPLPADVFHTQVVDVNYHNGLVWGRDPQFRFVFHPSRELALGLSLESPEQYIGGSGGGGLVTLPAALANGYARQLNDGTTTLAVPNAHPDVIGKIAFDPGPKTHVEVAGLFRTFRVYNPVSAATFTTHGFGGSFNAGFQLAKRLRVFTNNYLSDGGGRWIFGLAPDLVVRPDGSLSALHASATLDGVELQLHRTLLYGYYGGTFIGSSIGIDSTGRNPGSPIAQNKSIHESTLGLTQTLWRDPRYGGVQLLAQYSYLLRYPWFRAADAPANAHAGMVFLGLRYLLPGAAPGVEP